MEFTALDGGVAVVTLISGILAYARGFIRETLAIGAWVVAAVAAFYFAHRHSGIHQFRLAVFFDKYRICHIIF